MSDFPPPSPLTYRQILVASGGAPHSQRAVERAAQLAGHFGATLHLLTVVAQTGTPLMNAAAAFPGSEPFEAQALQDSYTQSQVQQQQTAQALRAQGLTVQEHLVPALKPADAILAVAAQERVDLIVLGRKHRSAWTAALAGSVSDMVSHAAEVDVLIAR